MSDDKNVIVGAILTAETPDSSGEVLCVKGCDISDLLTGSAPVNTEHLNTDEINEKEGIFDGFRTIVGRVITAKKIYGPHDASNLMEKKAWDEMQVPLVFGYVEIFDGPDAHDNAKAAASIIKNYDKAGAEQKLGFSVEGGTINRKGKLLTETVIRKLALTLKPCLHASKVALIQEDPPRVSKSEGPLRARMGGASSLFKSESLSWFSVMPNDYGLSKAYTKLKKTLAAGYATSAPSSRTQGAALQGSESSTDKLVRLFGWKQITKDFLKKACPEMSDNHINNILKEVKKRRIKKNFEEANSAYKIFNM